jgi:hypothetical protein
MPRLTPAAPPGGGRLPLLQVTVLCFANLNEAVQGNVIWPFIPAATRRWGAEQDDVGF